MTLRSLKFRRDYSNFLTLSNVGELVRNISKSRKRKKNALGEGVYKFSSQIFFGDLSFLDLGGGGAWWSEFS